MNKPIRVVEGTARPYEAFWQVRDAAQTGGDPEISFIGDISEYSWMEDAVTPKKFKADLYNVGKGGPITIRMHSGGGEIFAAAAIRAMLLDYPGDVTVSIDGLCASAAVAVALAGKHIKIFDTAYMMVHNPSYTGLYGSLDSETLLKFSKELTLFKEGLLNAYEKRTGLTRDVLSGMLDAETWMTAKQAVELGFADEVVTGGSPLKKEAKQTIRNYVNVPPVLLNMADDGINNDNGQESVVAHQTAQSFMQAHLARVEQSKQYVLHGEAVMNIRELLKARSEKIARAEQLTAAADAESRDFTEAERVEFETLLGSGDSKGEIGALDAQIEKIQAERSRLKAAVEMKLSANDPEKPANTSQAKELMKRQEFDKLDTSAQAAFVKRGGKIED